jgi:hypothetical protein
MCLRKDLIFKARVQYALKIYYQLTRIHKIQGTQNVEMHFFGSASHYRLSPPLEIRLQQLQH